MGKLNYSARKISGIKAAQVVSKDLKKRIPPNTGSKAASRDPHVEIDVAGKDLTDEGFAMYIDDLINCMTYRDDEHTEGMARVTEFHLQNNGLTVQSLRKLGEVVALGAGDLRELDISHNNIRVETAEEKEIWFKFLGCFENCYLLKKLDLGSNPLGAGGVEIFARVYIKSDLDYLEGDAEDVLGNKAEEENLVEEVAALKIANEKENETPASNTKSGSRQKKSPGKARVASGQNGSTHNGPKGITQAELKHCACTRGLRSIPYLILSDIAMTSSSAVILTGMLTMQRTAEHLLSFLPGGKAVALPDAVSECKSLIWKPNENLTPHAKRLLEIAEVIGDSKTDFLSEDDDEDHESQDDDTKDLMAQRKMQKKMDVEYKRLTKRVRMEALKQEGVKCIDIWHTALQMIFTSRALLLDDMDRATTSASEDSAPASEHEEEDVTMHPPVEELEQQDLPVDDGVSSGAPIHEATLQQYPIPEIVVREYSGSYEPTETSSPAMGPFHPDADAFDEEFPALQAPQAPQVETTPSPVIERTSEVSPPSQPKETTLKNGKGNARTSNGAKPSQKNQWRFGLSFSLWRRIIADAVGADGILDLQQQEQIIRYASDWNSVSYEMSIIGAEDHQQIWKMLETVGCFTYNVL